jgi:hypothetical protein
MLTKCRRAKKRCDQGLPACGRCVRLGKACGGYRDVNEMLFRDQTIAVTRRASGQSEGGPSASGESRRTSDARPTRSPTPEQSAAARNFFYQHFVSEGHLSFLNGSESLSPDALLTKPVIACGLAALSNREHDAKGREVARQYYVEAITGTNEALRHPRRVLEDTTLIAVFLLALFERLNWEDQYATQSWRHHVQGAAHVLELRGLEQVQSRSGADIFRDVRTNIIGNALIAESDVPPFVVQWNSHLEQELQHNLEDILASLASTVAGIKSDFGKLTKSDEELAGLAETTDAQLLDWSLQASRGKYICRSWKRFERTING